MKLRVRYYRSYPMDAEFEFPAEGHLGEAEKELLLEVQKTAVIGMHLWNIGEPGGPDVTPDGEDWVITRLYAFYKQAGRVCRERIRPIFEASRRSGVQVYHVATGRYAHKYPQYRETVEKFGESGPSTPGCMDRSWQEEHTHDRYGPEVNKVVMSRVKNKIRIPVSVAPASGDRVVLNAGQLNGYLRSQGVNTLIYTGFAANACLLFASGGINDLFRLGYRIILVRDATAALEEKRTARESSNRDAAVRFIDRLYGYSCTTADLLTALSEAN